MNAGLFSAYESRDEWKTLVERLGRAGCTSVYEISEGERPFLAAALRRGMPVEITADGEDAEPAVCALSALLTTKMD